MTPYLSPRFLAAVRGAHFIRELLTNLFTSIHQKDYYNLFPEAVLSPQMKDAKVFEPKHMNELKFGLVGLRVLLDRSRVKGRKMAPYWDMVKASEHYGLALVNINHGPDKLQRHMGSQSLQAMRHLIDITEI